MAAQGAHGCWRRWLQENTTSYVAVRAIQVPQNGGTNYLWSAAKVASPYLMSKFHQLILHQYRPAPALKEVTAREMSHSYITVEQALLQYKIAATQQKRTAIDFWPTPSLGMVRLRNFKNLGTKTKGMELAFRILVPEAAFFVWKLCCERRIEREDDPERWKMAQCDESTLPQQDQIMTNKLRFGLKATRKQLVLDTWNRLQDGEELPDDWIRATGVLSISPGGPFSRDAG
ncbi:hypothetical protein EV421DRAFT_1740691 [Armillaria borealis]|uniref:Uncharacterized protein n=1 Tax=Armillaria borealis TaxID=47425 RepID=A0AA39MI49_9AGAR|nr:hypothetical protein EV421DRAFT_1740691 [Armillaria borealis]